MADRSGSRYSSNGAYSSIEERKSRGGENRDHRLFGFARSTGGGFPRLRAAKGGIGEGPAEGDSAFPRMVPFLCSPVRPLEGFRSH